MVGKILYSVLQLFEIYFTYVQFFDIQFLKTIESSNYKDTDINHELNFLSIPGTQYFRLIIHACSL